MPFVACHTNTQQKQQDQRREKNPSSSPSRQQRSCHTTHKRPDNTHPTPHSPRARHGQRVPLKYCSTYQPPHPQQQGRTVRCSRPLFNNQTPHPPTPDPTTERGKTRKGGTEASPPPGRNQDRVIPQNPNSVPTPPPTTHQTRFHAPASPQGGPDLLFLATVGRWAKSSCGI